MKYGKIIAILHKIIFYIQYVKLEESRSHHFFIHSWPVFFHSLNRFVFLKKKKCLRVAGFCQSGVLYANHVPRVNIIGGTVSVATLNGAGGLGVF